MTEDQHAGLAAAIIKHDIDAVREQVRLGAHKTFDEGEGLTPMHIAALNGFAPAIDELAQAGVSVNDPDDRGLTPLHCAAQSSRDPAVVRRLIELGAQVNAMTDRGSTPLDLALATSHEESAHLIRAAGGRTRKHSARDGAQRHSGGGSRGRST